MTPLIGTGHVSPILLGGALGSVGFLMNTGFAALVPQLDTIALTVVLLSLGGKMLGRRGWREVYAPTPRAVLAAGGRFSRHSPIVWLPWQTKGPIQTLLGVSMGILGGWGAWTMLQSPATEKLAILPGWAIGIVCFFFFASGLKTR